MTSSYPDTKTPVNELLVATSIRYVAAPVTEVQFAANEVCVVEEAADVTGAAGTVISVIVVELEEAPDAFDALTR